MLDARLARRRGAFALDIDLEAPAGGTTVLVGESGAGKTTVLRLLAGLERLDAGRITLDGETWADAQARWHLPAWRRPIGYVAQDYALFPHLTVGENVAFGLRASGDAGVMIGPLVAEALDRVGIGELVERPAAALSGGQQQRVALARALVLRPRLLLLDEPLSALDLQTRRTVRVELRQLLASLACVTVYVTHSPVEALVFGDRIVVLDGGQVAQSGSREELLRRPRSPFVAELVGTNLLVGRPAGPGDANAVVRTPEGPLAIEPASGPGTVYLTVSPREITLFRSPPDGSAQNVFAGNVLEVVPEPPAGERVRVVIDTRPMLVAEVTREAVAALGLAPGARVHAAFKATGVQRYV